MFKLFVLQCFVLFLLATTLIYIKSGSLYSKKDEQEIPNDKFELLRKVLEIVVLLISMLK